MSSNSTAKRVVVCLSGGVDSSVAAALLVAEGLDVIGVFMRSGISGHTVGEKQGCCSVEDAMDARRVADQLGIPFYALNMEEAFGRLIDRFVNDYARGRTPNPCVLCNRWLKFGHVLRFARDVGASQIASGHYARVVTGSDGRRTLARPADHKKDQSYVLAVLEQDQLAALRLPLGELTKAQVRAEAEARGLVRVADKRDSQEICFVSGDYRDLLAERLSPEADALQPGEIQDPAGVVLGTHSGTAGFTVGQRRGLRVAAPKPLFVLETDPVRRLVLAGPRERLGQAGLEAEEAVWLAQKPEVGSQVAGRVQLRAHGTTHPAIVTVTGPRAFRLTFQGGGQAVVPGQAAVVYDETNTHVLFSGWVTKGTVEPS